MKISIIGAGNVGATCANDIINLNLADELVLLDVKEGVTEGKALDLWQTSSIRQFETYVYGVTDDYEATKDSDVVVITAGLPRKPGMSRDDLIEINAGIVQHATREIIKYSPDAKIVIVSNPLDVMTYASFMATNGKNPNEVFGMAGILDAARYKAFIAEELNVSPISVHAILMGGHGDTMVPLPRYTTISSVPVTELLSKEKLDTIIERTKYGGGELVKLMGTSAWYAPGAAAAQMVSAIVKNSRRLFPVSAYLQGEYGLNDLYMGVPVILGRNGIQQIIELKLNDEELELVHKSAESVKSVLEVLRQKVK
ncbi:Malate dehydrogenase [Salinivirga cyanobacteriivorans]|uniref:Malate dehydrogenase n=1 Tax=Salinivirga cyanobacteriivorans TaxID=1307839 RepID=A0A0S2I2Z7_9BACT|nr:malate dehydrogenase [Salinivirga cyanobacteriivorans]ALO16586.1 Malate dehydrogenase [Salinivirga cyanobacteriivorans]